MLCRIDCLRDVMDMDKRDLALDLLPGAWRDAAEKVGWAEAEELRLRLGRAPALLLAGSERVFRQEPVTEEQLQRILEKATGASMHAAVQGLSEGYVSYRGLRIGVCGTAVTREGKVSAFRHLSSLAVRIPKECRGICDEAAEALLRWGFRNTLVSGPPGAGKTTALRELIRRLSDSGLRLGVADERNELSAQDETGTGFDLGRCSDVICGVPKAEAAMMLLRGMNPQILAMDEITARKDGEALRRVYGCGVGILASVHSADPRKETGGQARTLLDQGLFSQLLIIRQEGARRRYTLEKWPP